MQFSCIICIIFVSEYLNLKSFMQTLNISKIKYNLVFFVTDYSCSKKNLPRCLNLN